jgi:hypothetical protein
VGVIHVDYPGAGREIPEAYTRIDAGVRNVGLLKTFSNCFVQASAGN